jgi:YaiO family outer membrane protein
MTRPFAILGLLAAATAARGAELELGYGHEFLTRGYADWRVTSLEAAWQPDGPSAGAGLLLRELERFGERDVELGAAGHVPLGRKWDLALAVSGCPTHEFMPLVSGAVQLQYAIGGGFVTTTGFKWSRYETDLVSTGAGIGRFGIERYFGAHRVSWTGYLATVTEAWSASQRVAWDLYYGERDRIGLGFAAGREIESTGSGPPLIKPVLSAALAGRHWIAADWAITYELGVQRQGDLYTRTGGRIGLRRRF